jgi:hypothetical protein
MFAITNMLQIIISIFSISSSINISSSRSPQGLPPSRGQDTFSYAGGSISSW